LYYTSQLNLYSIYVLENSEFPQRCGL